MSDIIFGIFLSIFNSVLLYFNLENENHFGTVVTIIALITSFILVHVGLVHNV